jgi:hypothetical protein
MVLPLAPFKSKPVKTSTVRRSAPAPASITATRVPIRAEAGLPTPELKVLGRASASAAEDTPC